MSLTVNTNIINDVNGYSLDAKQVKGGYGVVTNFEALAALPSATIVNGSLYYVSNDNKYYRYNGTTWNEEKFSGIQGVKLAGGDLTPGSDGKVNIPVENSVTSTSTTTPLSAAQGKALQDSIDNLKSIGRFLSIWNATTGAPTSEPSESPYSYKVGDYYRIGVAGNRNPANNSTYVIGGTNWISGGALGVGDVVYVSNISGSSATWVKQSASSGGTVQDVQINSTSILAGGIANLLVDTAAATSESSNLITSGAVYSGLAEKQDEITSSAMLSADLVDDSGTANKFVTEQQKTNWSAKQNAITASAKLSADLVDDTNSTNKFVTAQNKTDWTNKQNALAAQTAYTAKGSSTKVAQITTNSLGQVTDISEVDIAKTTLVDLGITATAAEINVLDGVTATTTELNYVDGVTSNIQTQLNNKSKVIIGQTGTSTIKANYITVDGTEYEVGGGNVDDVKIGNTSIVSNKIATIPLMTGATASADGAAGLVPPATSAQKNKYLRGDGTWNAPVISNTAFGFIHTTSSDDPTTWNYTYTHNLNTQNLMVQLTDAQYNTVITDVERTSATTITIKFAINPGTTTYNVYCIAQSTAEVPSGEEVRY